MLDEVSKLQIPTTICTIYNPNFGFPEQQRACETGLTAVNDVILRESIQVRTIKDVDFFSNKNFSRLFSVAFL